MDKGGKRIEDGKGIQEGEVGTVSVDRRTYKKKKIDEKGKEWWDKRHAGYQRKYIAKLKEEPGVAAVTKLVEAAVKMDKNAGKVAAKAMKQIAKTTKQNAKVAKLSQQGTTARSKNLLRSGSRMLKSITGRLTTEEKSDDVSALSERTHNARQVEENHGEDEHGEETIDEKQTGIDRRQVNFNSPSGKPLESELKAHLEGTPIHLPLVNQPYDLHCNKSSDADLVHVATRNVQYLLETYIEGMIPQSSLGQNLFQLDSRDWDPNVWAGLCYLVAERNHITHDKLPNLVPIMRLTNRDRYVQWMDFVFFQLARWRPVHWSPGSLTLTSLQKQLEQAQSENKKLSSRNEMLSNRNSYLQATVDHLSKSSVKKRPLDDKDSHVEAGDPKKIRGEQDENSNGDQNEDNNSV